MSDEHFSLQWDNFHKNMSAGIQSLLESEDLVDVTLAVEGRQLKAHKMVLSLCSPYFRQLFQSSPCKHPIVFMRDVTYTALIDLLQFMYHGEVQVAEENLSIFIKTAEALQIKGLAEDSRNHFEDLIGTTKSTNEATKRSTAEVSPPFLALGKRLRSKRVRVSSPSPSSSAAPAVVPAENLIFLKTEPSDNTETSTDKEVADETQDSYVDETSFEKDNISMETNEDEPKHGTSSDGTGESQLNLAEGHQGKANKLRERVVLTIEKKIEICNRLENGDNRLKIMKDYGISSSSVYDIRKQKNELLKFNFACENSRASKQRKILRKPKFEQLDTILYKWFIIKQSEGSPISGPILKEKAKEFYDEMKLTKKCTFSDGWLTRFKLRHGISKLDISGERKPLDCVAAKE